MAMPKTVPIMAATDMCIVPSQIGDCRCLQTLASDVFGCDYTSGAIENAMLAAHTDIGTKVPEMNARAGSVLTFETTRYSSRGVTRKAVARVWNRAMAILGYVVGNPECDRRGKLKPVRKRK